VIKRGKERERRKGGRKGGIGVYRSKGGRRNENDTDWSWK